MNPGDIYLADIPEAGEHPVVIVSREELNRGQKVLAALITSAKFTVRRTFANCVVLNAGQFGMTKDCVIQCEAIAPIPKDVLEAGPPLATLDETTMREVIRAIGYVLDSDCEPV